jgi:hypothetical protein
LKTKAEVQFDRAVTERSKPFFPVFQASTQCNFSPVLPFLLFGRQKVATHHGLHFADCYLFSAERYVVKDRPTNGLFSLEGKTS